MVKRFVGLGAIIAALLAMTQPLTAADLRRYETRYYILYTDIDERYVPETIQRITRMAEEYYLRTQSFSGAINERFRFELYRRSEDYYTAGGLPGSAGVYMGGRNPRLMAIAGNRMTSGTWRIIQHEGFHQFADRVMGGRRPPWLNEGIAEYFGDSIFTGDNFISGILLPERIARIQNYMRRNQFPALADLMLMDQRQWNTNLQGVNYDMSWAIFQFLAHGDDGAYQRPFEQFMISIGRGTDWQVAWRNHFGAIDGFEEQWRAYWLNLDVNAGRPLFQQGAVEALTSYLARAELAGQTFETFDALFEAITENKVQMEYDPLPRSLAQNLVRWMGNMTVTLEDGPRNTRQIHAVMPNGDVAIGSYELRRGEVRSVSVQFDSLPSVLARVRELIEADDKVTARQVLQRAIREHPRSPFIVEARQLMLETR